MSFSKAKLKRFNDIDVLCASPATISKQNIEQAATNNITTPNAATSTAITSSLSAHTERKEQIEKFFKDAVSLASNSKEFALTKEGAKEDKKPKGLRLFRTPSLPHRLRFRQHSDITNSATANNNNTKGSGSTTGSSTPLHSAKTTPVKELPKSGSKLRGKDALQQELRQKNEVIESYMSQIDVLKRHVELLKATEQKIHEEHENVVTKTDMVIQALTTENSEQKSLNNQLSADNSKLQQITEKLQRELQALRECHSEEVQSLNRAANQLKIKHEQLEQVAEHQMQENMQLHEKIAKLDQELFEAREKLVAVEEKSGRTIEIIANLRNTNDTLMTEVKQLKQQIENDALSYAQETKTIVNQMNCLRNERNTLKNDLACKCELIRSLQDELLDKNCEIDEQCDTIRQLCREKVNFVEKERLMQIAEEKIRTAEFQAAQKVEKLESDLDNMLEREKAYWRSELDKRQKLAENEIIKIELEKQDVMVLLETTNDMLRDRDEKIQKYEDQLRNGLEYYINLTDALQKQVVDLKQDVAKTITEKYNYQLTLNNTRSTVNILMERLRKSDSDVEQYKNELESLQLAKGALEQSYITLQNEMENLRKQLSYSENALQQLLSTSQNLQQEVQMKENMFHEILISEEATLAKFNKIASSFQERIDVDAARYLDLYNDIKNKDDTREIYIQDMKKTLDEFATVLQFAQIELDNKEKALLKVRDECEQLKLENISLKSKLDNETQTFKKENSTDMEKIEDLLIDSELRAECDKITSWLLSSTEKCVRTDSAQEISELLKPTTPNSNKVRTCTTPVRITTATTNNTPRTPRTPKAGTPRTTPKKTVLFVGKENIPSPQKHVLKTRNM